MMPSTLIAAVVWASVAASLPSAWSFAFTDCHGPVFRRSNAGKTTKQSSLLWSTMTTTLDTTTTTTTPTVPSQKLLLDLISSLNSATLSQDRKAAVMEAIEQAEQDNPTAKPAVSTLLNGVWNLVYATGYSPNRYYLALFLYSGGSSPELWALGAVQKLVPSAFLNLMDLTHLQLTIQPLQQPRASTRVTLRQGDFSGTVQVEARLETASTVRLKETYESASFLFLDNDHDEQETTPLDRIPPFLQYSRSMEVTYLDEEVLILRDVKKDVREVFVRAAFSNE